jgi:carbonic anhydrase/acetyltransferase-like protein (isoleucine patch superfamily)
MRLRDQQAAPVVDPSAYVAPTAVLRGDVQIGPDSRILHGAVVSADGGSVRIGSTCVVMEHAVVRGTPAHQVVVGDHVLVGPHAYLCGCRVDDEVFIATGATVFNGAWMGRASSVALGGAVHIGCRVPDTVRVPIGWVAVGDPARLYPPDDVEPVRAGLAEAGGAGGFLPYVFGVDPTADRGAQMRAAMTRYARALGRQRDDEILPEPGEMLP